MPTEQQIREQVRELLARTVPGFDTSISDDVDIFSMGLDSISTMLLLTEIENLYSISLGADEIPFEQFRTIAGISSFVAWKCEAQIAPGTDVSDEGQS